MKQKNEAPGQDPGWENIVVEGYDCILLHFPTGYVVRYYKLFAPLARNCPTREEAIQTAAAALRERRKRL
jgi:hypothetical protein